MVAVPPAAGPLIAAVGCLALAPRAARGERVEAGDVAFGVVAGLLLAGLTGNLTTALAMAMFGALAWPVLLLLLEMEDARIMPALGALLFAPIPVDGRSLPAFTLVAPYALLAAMTLDMLAQHEVYVPGITVEVDGGPDFPNFVNLPAVIAIACLACALLVR